MNYRPLGKTGLNVSAIALGTVSLGVDYGIEVPGAFGRPEEEKAINLIQLAADAGINLFDTAPAYGESEHLLGKAIGRRHDCYIATKVSVPVDADGNLLTGSRLQHRVEESLANSLRFLKREALDIVQVHNATKEIITQGEFVKVLLRERDKGTIRFLGASVYGEDSALAVIGAGCFDVLQVAYNLLDQRMANNVFPAAKAAGVGIVTRSVFLKGALTVKANWLPAELAPLRQAAEEAKETLAAGSWEALPQVAMRFCLSTPYTSTILVGVSTIEELSRAVSAERAGPLPDELLARTSNLMLDDEYLLNPSYWSVP